MLRKVLLLFAVFYAGCLSAASLPSKSYVTKDTYDEEMAYYMFQQEMAQQQGVMSQEGFESAQEAMIDPMLKGPPDLPPDPGEETPVGDWLPLVFLSFAYMVHKGRKMVFKPIK